MESWRRNPDPKDSNGLKSEADRWRKRDDKIEDSAWKRREQPERRDMDKWRRNEDSDRWKDSMEKWRDNFDKDDRERDRDRERGMDGRPVSTHFFIT